MIARIQPRLLGFADTAIFTLAPLFAAAVAPELPDRNAGWGLSGHRCGHQHGRLRDAVRRWPLTGRGGRWRRGIVTGGGARIGAGGHSTPFLLPYLETAFVFAIIVVIVELFAIEWVRWRYFPGSSVRGSVIQVMLAGAIDFAVGILFGYA